MIEGKDDAGWSLCESLSGGEGCEKRDGEDAVPHG
jgi:hypothetical protein